jgi:hypothetical protein
MSLNRYQQHTFVIMKMLDVGDKIDVIRNGELQLILTVQEVEGNLVKAVGRNGYVTRYRRESDGVLVRPADPLAESAYIHTGQPPEHFSPSAKQRYYDRSREM